MGGPLGGVIFGRRGGYGGGRNGGGGPMGGGGYGPHTQPAGTAQIARESGGDSMPVDDAAALETTLSRLRQRYALHFLIPEGARPGQERTISVALSDSARRRYPDADLRFRHVYIAPSGGVESAGRDNPSPRYLGPTETTAAGAAEDPVTVTPAPREKRRAMSEPEAPRGPIPAGESNPPEL